ncbi:MAG TPA: DUF3467 domain-containing protein [bacterium]|nr:DUF3467 domain-containing protein [bacterium]
MTKKKEYKAIISEEAKYGEYTNFVKIQHSGVDFRCDFAKILPEEESVYFHTRLFMSPIHAKLLMKAMQDNIEKYEAQFGTIELKMDRTVHVSATGSQETH